MSVPRQTRQPLVPGGDWCRLVSRAADSSDAASTSMARHHFSDPAGPPIAHYTSDRRRLRPPDLSRHPRSARATRRATVGVARPVPALVMVADDRGASIVTTMHRLVVVRDRAGFRPRSGVRSWRHEVIHGISLSPPMRGQARIGGPSRKRARQRGEHVLRGRALARSSAHRRRSQKARGPRRHALLVSGVRPTSKHVWSTLHRG
jgi:hypothetical protein